MFKLGDKVTVLGGPGWHRGAKEDIGKRGFLVCKGGTWGDAEEQWGVHIPESTSPGAMRNGVHYTWWVKGSEIKLAREEQLLFSFMTERKEA